MTIAYVQTTHATNTTGTLVTPAFGSATVAGRLIVVMIADDSGNTTTVSSVTDNKGNTYAKVFGVTYPSLQCWYSVIGTGGSGHTISVAWSTAATGHVSAIAQEFSGLTGPSPLDTFVQADGSGVNASSGATGVPSGANSLVVVGATNDSTTANAISLGPVTQGGKNTVGATTDTNCSNHMNGSKFTVAATGGFLSSISINIGTTVAASPNNSGQIALYTDSAGVPGTLVASSASQALTANAWNTFPLSATLTANATYWLMFNTNGLTASDNNLRYDSAAAGTSRSASQAFGTWPGTFPSSSAAAVQYSMYASYTQFSNLDQVTTAFANLGMCSKVINSPVAQTGTMTLASTASWLCATVIFKETSTNTGPTPAVLGGFFLSH